jgi:hypothetical protein
MKQDILKQMYGTTPESFQNRVYIALRKTEETPAKQRLALRTALIATAILVLCMGLVYAAFSSKVAEFYGQFYGNDMKTWLEEGDAATPLQSFTMGDITYTLDEVVYRDNGLYGVGTIRLPKDSANVLIPEDHPIDTPYGYDAVYGVMDAEIPADAPTIADVVREKGGKLIMVRAIPDQIGVDGGALLTPSELGYTLIPQQDGSVRFSFEISDAYVVEEGESYTIQMWSSAVEKTPEGQVLDDTFQGESWTVDTIKPTPIH